MYVKNYASGNPWLPGKVVRILGATMYAVLLNDGRNVRKHADQMRMRVDDTPASNPPDDSVEMRLPQSLEGSDHSEDDPIVSEPTLPESSGGEPPLTPSPGGQNETPNADDSSTNDSSNTDESEPNQDPLIPLRRSNRVRNPPNYFGH